MHTSLVFDKAMSNSQRTRPVNAKELTFLHKFNTRLSRFLNDMDELKNTVVYRQELKKTGNQFLKQLEQLAAQYIWRKDLSDEDIQGAMNDFSNILDFAENMEMVAMGMEYIDPDKQKAFLAYMDKGFRQFGMPLSVVGETVIYSPKVSELTMASESEEPIRWMSEDGPVQGMIDKQDDGFVLRFANKQYGPYPQLAMAKALYGKANKVRSVYWKPTVYKNIA